MTLQRVVCREGQQDAAFYAKIVGLKIGKWDGEKIACITFLHPDGSKTLPAWK